MYQQKITKKGFYVRTALDTMPLDTTPDITVPSQHNAIMTQHHQVKTPSHQKEDTTRHICKQTTLGILRHNPTTTQHHRDKM